jgi:hypothetical protein
MKLHRVTVRGFDFEQRNDIADGGSAVLCDDGSMTVPIGVVLFPVEKRIPDKLVRIQDHSGRVFPVNQHDPFLPGAVNSPEEFIRDISFDFRKYGFSIPEGQMQDAIGINGFAFALEGDIVQFQKIEGALFVQRQAPCSVNFAGSISDSLLIDHYNGS